MARRQAAPIPKKRLYGYRNGAGFKVKASIVGPELDRIERNRGGDLTPGAVVNEARPATAPLHPVFEWRDPIAAERYREDQARSLIRYTVRYEEGEERPQAPFRVHVTRDDGEDVYVTTARAMSDAQMMDQVLREARNYLQGFTERYGHLSQYARVVEAIDEAE